MESMVLMVCQVPWVQRVSLAGRDVPALMASQGDGEFLAVAASLVPLDLLGGMEMMEGMEVKDCLEKWYGDVINGFFQALLPLWLGY